MSDAAANGERGVDPGAGSAANGARGDASRTTRKIQKTRTMTATLGLILLGSQLLVVFLCALGILGLRLVPFDVGLWMGGGLIALQLAAIATLQVTGSPLLGWVVEILCVLAGFIHPAMFIVGGIFLAAWIYCMLQGRKIDRLRAPVIAAYERALAEGASEEEARAAAARVGLGEA